jgi:hypothetical protein
LTKNACFGTKLTVFQAKSSIIGHTKTALAAIVANSFCYVVLFWVAEGSFKNLQNCHFEFPCFAGKIM